MVVKKEVLKSVREELITLTKNILGKNCKFEVKDMRTYDMFEVFFFVYDEEKKRESAYFQRYSFEVYSQMHESDKGRVWKRFILDATQSFWELKEKDSQSG